MTGPGPGVELSIIVPTYNEKQNIAVLIPALSQTFSDLKHEILVVDDQSPDGTGAEVLRLAAEGYACRLVTKPVREGIGAALRYGYDQALGVWIASTDADLSFEPSDLKRLYTKALEGFDLVLGVRHVGEQVYEAPTLPVKIKRWVSGNGNRTLRLVTGIPVNDFSANFRIIRRDVWIGIQTTEKTNTLLFEMILKVWLAKGRIGQVPVSFLDRRYGRSKLNLTVEAPKFLIKLVTYLFRYGIRLRSKR